MAYVCVCVCLRRVWVSVSVALACYKGIHWLKLLLLVGVFVWGGESNLLLIPVTKK